VAPTEPPGEPIGQGPPFGALTGEIDPAWLDSDDGCEFAGSH
jgi:hypothetical protein